MKIWVLLARDNNMGDAMPDVYTFTTEEAAWDIERELRSENLLAGGADDSLQTEVSEHNVL